MAEHEFSVVSNSPRAHEGSGWVGATPSFRPTRRGRVESAGLPAPKTPLRMRGRNEPGPPAWRSPSPPGDARPSRPPPPAARGSMGPATRRPVLAAAEPAGLPRVRNCPHRRRRRRVCPATTIVMRSLLLRVSLGSPHHDGSRSSVPNQKYFGVGTGARILPGKLARNARCG